MTHKTNAIPIGRPTFLGMPRCEDLHALKADVAILGVPFGIPYDIRASVSVSSSAPDAVRQQSLRVAPMLTHYNFDFGGSILAQRPVTIVDCGDVVMEPGRYEDNSRAVAAAIKAIRERGALPIVLGGDHSVTTPVLQGYEGMRSLCVVQIDAHLDWRDEVNGVRFGLSSPMRRSSEMPWVNSMIQIGLRWAGSARQAEVDAARKFGSILVTAEELHRVGVDDVLRRVPPADHYYITIDADGLDAPIAPGVGFPSFGGLSYWEATHLLRGIAGKGRVVGLDLVEIVPGLDVGNITSLLGAQLIANIILAAAQAGQIGSPAS